VAFLTLDPPVSNMVAEVKQGPMGQVVGA